MVFNFNNIFESFNQEAITAEMQIQVGDAVIKKENISAPGFIIEQQYIQTLKRIISEKPKPMSVKITVGKDIFDDAGNFVRKIYNSVESSNYTREYKEDV